MTRTLLISSKRRAFLFVALFSLIVIPTCLMPSGAAMAQSLQDLRSSGVVGEGYDGFVHVRDGGSAVKSSVNAINAKRQGVYAARASEQGTSIDQVGRIYASEIMGKAASGTWFLSENGTWSQK